LTAGFDRGRFRVDARVPYGGARGKA
jgi:hypothetical protein